MNDLQKTIAYISVAVLVAIIAFFVQPSPVTPDQFLDQGELFFAEFTDPNSATTLEVIEFSEETGSAHPFKVTFTNGIWKIPSHHDYPADGKDRLAQTAASVIDLNKDVFRTDKVVDHEACGVVDPLDESLAGLSGRGKRITLKGVSGEVFADLIVGNEVLERPGYRFVRVPGQNRVYASNFNAEISTDFSDWIDKDLLQIDSSKIDQITLKDYSINERTLSVDQRENLILYKNEDGWTADRIKSNKSVDSVKMKSLLAAIDELSIVGVRPKPAGLSSSLKALTDGNAISQQEQISLQQKGFYLSRDGQLLSNEGELQVATSDGVRYTLRFGEILTGSGLQVSAGTSSDNKSSTNTNSENRYLFLTAKFDPGKIGRAPQKPSNTEFNTKPDSLLTDDDRANRDLQNAYNSWQQKIDNGKLIAESLNQRFAEWYYVISAEKFADLDMSRSDLVISN